MEATGRQVCSAACAKTQFIRWTTPIEEIDGTVSVARFLIQHRTVAPKHLCIAVPNRNWAMQVQRACTRIGMDSIVCIPPAHMSAQARAAVTLLAEAAQGDNAGMPSNDLIDQCRATRGNTLAHLIGLDKLSEFSNVLPHICGDEDANHLHGLITRQLANPTLPSNSQALAIMHYEHLNGSFEQLFLISCVNGLIPNAAAFDAKDEHERLYKLEEARTAFLHAMTCASKSIAISAFSKIDATLARAAHVRVARYKTERGQLLAMAEPSLFLEEEGDTRPCAIGGQTFLRAYDLN